VSALLGHIWGGGWKEAACNGVIACMHTEWLLFSKEGAVHVSAAMNETEHWELTASLADCRCLLIYRRHVEKQKMKVIGICKVFDPF
jgi:hypothetical protein